MGGRKGNERKGESDAGPAMCRHQLTKLSAWDMAFTERSQMPWQFIRSQNASHINTTCTHSWANTQSNMNKHLCTNHDDLFNRVNFGKQSI